MSAEEGTRSLVAWLNMTGRGVDLGANQVLSFQPCYTFLSGTSYFCSILELTS